MVKIYEGVNPTEMYLESLKDLVEQGEEYSPRGKLIKELRPVVFQFKDPRQRVTFLPGRSINPFFQMAEALWIIQGRSDVSELAPFNSNIKNFSDDGIWFNAAYGERLRRWDQNLSRGFIFNPIDQLHDVYIKLLNDKDTRQAVAVIYNPRFDNSDYTLSGGLDIACNLVLTFKVRQNALDLTVFNRSNDIHWGLFGANLNQFTTIQETVWSWLRNSDKEEFNDLELGTYTHITDSLHVYINDYGSSITDSIFSAVNTDGTETIESSIFPTVSINSPFKFVDEDLGSDPYFKMILRAEEIYWNYKNGNYGTVYKFMDRIPNCNWKIAMYRFMKNKLIEAGRNEFMDAISRIQDIDHDLILKVLGEYNE